MLLNPNEKIRLLRLTPGANTDDVVEELFAMAGDTQRAQLPNGIDLTPDDPLQPPIVADWSGDQDFPFMQLDRDGEIFDISIDASGNFNVNGSPMEGSGGGGGSSSATNVYPARVDAYLGSNQYTVTIYPRGTNEAGTQVTATQLEGDPLFPQTADGTRYTFVVKAGSQYSMNMPTWG